MTALHISLQRKTSNTTPLSPSLKLCLSSTASCPFYLHFHYWPTFPIIQATNFSHLWLWVFFLTLQLFNTGILKYPLVLTHPFQSFQCQSSSLSSGIFEQPLVISTVFHVFPFLSGLHITTYIIFLQCRFVPVFSLIKKRKEKRSFLSSNYKIMAKLLSRGSIAHCRAPSYSDHSVPDQKHACPSLPGFDQIIFPA